MTAVEEIQAAIEKLERLKAGSTPKPWHHWTDELTGDVDLWHDQEVRSHIAGLGRFGDPRVYRDAELIVTLHRTIDAQLAILAEEAQRVANTRRMAYPVPYPILGHHVEAEGLPMYEVDRRWYDENRPDDSNGRITWTPQSVTISEADLHEIDPSITVWLPIEPAATILALARAIIGPAS